MTSNIAFSGRTCTVTVAVTNKSNMPSYFPEAENFNGRSDVAGPSSVGSGDLFELSDKSLKTDPESLNLATHGWTPSWI